MTLTQRDLAARALLDAGLEDLAVPEPGTYTNEEMLDRMKDDLPVLVRLVLRLKHRGDSPTTIRRVLSFAVERHVTDLS